jgi:hypothetical protein
MDMIDAATLVGRKIVGILPCGGSVQLKLDNGMEIGPYQCAEMDHELVLIDDHNPKEPRILVLSAPESSVGTTRRVRKPKGHEPSRFKLLQGGK